MSVADNALTPSNSFEPPPRVGLGITDHRAPSQCRVAVLLTPEGSLCHPTAHTSFSEMTASRCGLYGPFGASGLATRRERTVQSGVKVGTGVWVEVAVGGVPVGVAVAEAQGSE